MLWVPGVREGGVGNACTHLSFSVRVALFSEYVVIIILPGNHPLDFVASFGCCDPESFASDPLRRRWKRPKTRNTRSTATKTRTRGAREEAEEGGGSQEGGEDAEMCYRLCSHATLSERQTCRKT